MLWTELCPLQTLYVEALTPNVIRFGDRNFREIIRLNEVIKVEP